MEVTEDTRQCSSGKNVGFRLGHRTDAAHNLLKHGNQLGMQLSRAILVGGQRLFQALLVKCFQRHTGPLLEKREGRTVLSQDLRLGVKIDPFASTFRSSSSSRLRSVACAFANSPSLASRFLMASSWALISSSFAWRPRASLASSSHKPCSSASSALQCSWATVASFSAASQAAAAWVAACFSSSEAAAARLSAAQTEASE